MSVEAHPNINAAGMTAAIIEAFIKYVRGPAAKADGLTGCDRCDKVAALYEVQESITKFVIEISERLDERFGTQ